MDGQAGGDDGHGEAAGRRLAQVQQPAEPGAGEAERVLDQVVPDVLYVDEGDVLTSGGVAAGIDLCLHVVRKDFGAEIANSLARRLVVGPHRDGGQAQFVEQPVAAAFGGRFGSALTWRWSTSGRIRRSTSSRPLRR